MLLCISTRKRGLLLKSGGATVSTKRPLEHREFRITRAPVLVTLREQLGQQDKRRKTAETYRSLFALQARQMPDLEAVLLAVAGQFRHLTKLLQRPTRGTVAYVSAIERRWRTVTINASTTLCQLCQHDATGVLLEREIDKTLFGAAGLVLELKGAYAVEDLEAVLEAWEKVPSNEHSQGRQRENAAHKGAVGITQFAREHMRQLSPKF